jgi:hypothetical protein
MKSTAVIIVAVAAVSGARHPNAAVGWVAPGLAQEQEKKPVPKDSVRVSVPGCSKNYIFTVGPRTQEEPGRFDIPEGMHLRMNGPKKMLAEIKAHEGSAIEITGLMKKGQYNDGFNLGGGVRITPGSAPTAGGIPSTPAASQNFIDVESWRSIEGACPSR